MFQNINENTIDLDSKNENKKSTNNTDLIYFLEEVSIICIICTFQSGCPNVATLHSFIYAIFCWTK